MAFLQTFDLTIRLKGGILLVIMAEVKKKKSAKDSKKTGIMVTPELFPASGNVLPVSVMRRAVAAFLAEQCPAGIAMRVFCIATSRFLL